MQKTKSKTVEAIQEPRFDFLEAYNQGKIVDRSGYHKTVRYNSRVQYDCGCSDLPNLEDNHSYRDLKIDYQGFELLYLHQNLISYITPRGVYVFRDCGYKTRVTKTRLNRGLCNISKYKIVQRNFTWYIKDTDTGELSDWNGILAVNSRGKILRSI